jgi:hypothetical protein
MGGVASECGEIHYELLFLRGLLTDANTEDENSENRSHECLG